ncbi:hypothetical protein VNO78_08100 [Psophocarpus tetragonolobus]|uniref:Uncharacterized protein n=1 Tax=Psophocarpus tetragonolobus TaxID=3891 RepID=A0AAN9SU75_PSOTE
MLSQHWEPFNDALTNALSPQHLLMEKKGCVMAQVLPKGCFREREKLLRMMILNFRRKDCLRMRLGIYELGKT